MYRYLWRFSAARARDTGARRRGGRARRSGYEVWAVDQSNTNGTTSGGTIHIYDGSSLGGGTRLRRSGADRPRAAAVGLCVAQTGTAPVRPHMLFFNSRRVARGPRVRRVRARALPRRGRRTPLACIDVGVQAHAAVPSPDESYVVVANQNGKLLQRIWTDYSTNTFTLEPGATLDLANGTTPTGALAAGSGAPARQRAHLPARRLDEPAGIRDAARRRALRRRQPGDADADRRRVRPRDDPRQRLRRDRDRREDVRRLGRRYGDEHVRVRRLRVHTGGLPLPTAAFCTFERPNMPAAKLVVSQDDRRAHRRARRDADQARPLLWVADRAGNRIVVIETATDEVVDEISFAGR